MSNDLNQRLAQAEKLLAEIKEAMAAKPGDDKSLPSRVEDAIFTVDWRGDILELYSDREKEMAIACGNAYRTREQAVAWAHVRSVIGRIRQIPGQVDPSVVEHECINVNVVKSEVIFEKVQAGRDYESCYLLPAFAIGCGQHAIDTIGPDNLIRCAATMAGVGINRARPDVSMRSCCDDGRRGD